MGVQTGSEKKKRRQFTKEFRAEAVSPGFGVRTWIETATVSEVARDIDLTETSPLAIGVGETGQNRLRE